MRILPAFTRAVLVLAALLLGLPAGAVPAKAKSARHAKVERSASAQGATRAKRAKARGKGKAKGTKRRRGRRSAFSGHGVFNGLRTAPLARPSGKLHLYSVNHRDEVKVTLFHEDGSYDEAAMAKLNHFVRARSAGTERAIEPRLYEILAHISDHFGGRVLEFVSGFRDQPRATSYHYLGSAMDMRVRGVSIRELRQYVKTLDTGGMGLGLYPRVGFIHVDVRPEPSYYWTDRSGHSRGKKRKAARKVPRS